MQSVSGTSYNFLLHLINYFKDYNKHNNNIMQHVSTFQDLDFV